MKAAQGDAQILPGTALRLWHSFLTKFLHGYRYGGTPTVPEFKEDQRCDPFAVDVNCLGNVVREKFTHGDSILEFPPRRNVEFLEELIADMTQDDPTKRPRMSEVVSRFAEIRKSLSWWKLRSRVSNKRIPLIFHRLYSPFHWIKQLSYIIRRIPAIPDYTRATLSLSTGYLISSWLIFLA
ncbi:hypothetical protein D9757_008690 [Collybiopsis confluens]|uniref:Protein kinase domain-containing protein n=1 Tax=Collybiopsis confluens TaxID=2823264 RepID=A0A8H5H3S1_9AGAR|nr:hypothetical protein D9757_008690 [Collybiopsis confluens]